MWRALKNRGFILDYDKDWIFYMSLAFVQTRKYFVVKSESLMFWKDLALFSLLGVGHHLDDSNY